GGCRRFAWLMWAPASSLRHPCQWAARSERLHNLEGDAVLTAGFDRHDGRRCPPRGRCVVAARAGDGRLTMGLRSAGYGPVVRGLCDRERVLEAAAWTRRPVLQRDPALGVAAPFACRAAAVERGRGTAARAWRAGQTARRWRTVRFPGASHQATCDGARCAGSIYGWALTPSGSPRGVGGAQDGSETGGDSQDPGR